jgi:hypothetical protein
VITGMINNEEDNFSTSGNAMLRFEGIKFLNRTETLLGKFSSDE